MDAFRGRTVASQHFPSPEVAIAPPPTELRWLVAVGAVLTVVATVAAAIGATSIETTLAVSPCCVVDSRGAAGDPAAQFRDCIRASPPRDDGNVTTGSPAPVEG